MIHQNIHYSITFVFKIIRNIKIEKVKGKSLLLGVNGNSLEWHLLSSCSILEQPHNQAKGRALLQASSVSLQLNEKGTTVTSS